jgi:hypothetical protein
MQPKIIAILRWVGFVGIGVTVAAVGETQYSVFIRGEYANLFGAVVFNTLYLSVSATFTILQKIKPPALCVAAHTVLFGSLGLGIEWFLIGNSPWGNPDAHQAAMFAYWACMVVVPLVYVSPAPHNARLKQRILLVALLYSVAALAAQTIPWPIWRMAYHIWSVILGYMALLVWVAVAYARVPSPPASSATAAPQADSR